MSNIATPRQIKAFEKFNDELDAYIADYGIGGFADLYEDAYTTRCVRNFKLFLNGKLTWEEKELGQEGHKEEYKHIDSDDVADTLNFWRANFRRAKRYNEMDTEKLDLIQNGEVEDDEE